MGSICEIRNLVQTIVFVEKIRIESVKESKKTFEVFEKEQDLEIPR